MSSRCRCGRRSAREPAAGDTLQRGQSAGIGFWNNRNGQALIKSLDGGVSWESVGGKSLSLKLADHPDCPGTDPATGGIIYGNGGVGHCSVIAVRQDRHRHHGGAETDVYNAKTVDMYCQANG